ncbi:hypothetical protein AB0T83_02445 [Fluviibacterium sp. DFM31]|uniref:Uncharacterized protein n=1 Tax=Meridianimarinicoccus marinus TaxID=3231483 RepID=A0ABV3L268_9RHOB
MKANRMYLTKFCHTKDHPSNRGTLKLGTLHSYRNEELGEIHDPEEGIWTTQLVFDPSTQFSKSWLKDVLFGAVIPKMGNFIQQQQKTIVSSPFDHPGKMIIDVEKVVTLEETQTHARLSGQAKITIDLENILIFCMSIDLDGNMDSPFSYDSKWSLPKSKAPAFSNLIGGLLPSIPLTSLDLSTHDGIQLHHTSGIRIAGSYGEVRYIDKEIKIQEEADFTKEMMEEIFKNCHMTKDTKFQPENEFRFWYRFSLGSSIVPVTGDFFPMVNQLVGIGGR